MRLTRKRISSSPARTDSLTINDVPVFIGQIEIAEALSVPSIPEPDSGVTYRSARLLVRLHGTPIGYVTLPPKPLNADELAAQIWRQRAVEINAHLQSDGLAPVVDLPVAGLPPAAPDRLPCRVLGVDGAQPLVTVAMCTRDRPQGAIATLRKLAALEYAPLEIIVIDNAPSDDSTRAAVTREFGNDARVRYVREPRPGLSCARNRAVAEARGEYIAFTDDDASPDRRWVHGLVRGFQRADRVACVTGLVPSMEISNVYQLYFDQRVAWGTNCVPRVYDRDEHAPASILFPFTASTFGTGANFALRKDVLTRIGGFDEALGAGSPTGGGEDLDMFARIILGGWRLAYEPSAVVGHIHRSGPHDLSRQMWSYGTGLTAFLFKYLVNPRTMWRIVRAVPAGVRHMLAATARPTTAAALPRSLAYPEIAGLLAGPVLYAWAWLRARMR